MPISDQLAQGIGDFTRFAAAHGRIRAVTVESELNAVEVELDPSTSFDPRRVSVASEGEGYLLSVVRPGGGKEVQTPVEELSEAAFEAAWQRVSKYGGGDDLYVLA